MYYTNFENQSNYKYKIYTPIGSFNAFGALVIVCVLGALLEIYTRYSFYRLALVVSLFLTFAIIVSQRHLPKHLFSFKALYFLFLLMFASGLWSINQEVTFRYSIYLAYNLILFELIGLAVIDCKWIKKLFLFLPYIGFLIITVVWLEHGAVRPNYETRDLQDEFGSLSNHIPAIVIVCLPFLIMSFSEYKNKAIILGSLIALLAVVVLSQSRGGLSSYLLTLAGCLFFIKKFSLKIKLMFFLLLISLVFIIMMPSSIIEKNLQGIYDRFSDSALFDMDFFDDADLPSQFSGSDYRRALMYKYGVRAIYENPILGIGFNTFKDYMGIYYPVNPVVSHNWVITFWGELGLIGLILGFAVFFIAYKKIFFGLRFGKMYSDSIYKFYASLCIALSVIIFAGMFRPQLNNPVLYLILAIVFYLNPVNLLEKNKKYIKR